MTEQADIFTKMRTALDEERRRSDAFRVRHFGVADEVSAERVSRRRREQESQMQMQQVQEEGRAERLSAALRTVWSDLDRLHSEGCARVGVGCPACEAQELIEGVL